MSEKFDLAAKITITQVADILAQNNNWDINEALSKLSKSHIYELLSDSKTELWMDNPIDIADLFERELAGEILSSKDFYK